MRTHAEIEAAARVLDPGAFLTPIYGAELAQDRRQREVLDQARRALEAADEAKDRDQPKIND